MRTRGIPSVAGLMAGLVACSGCRSSPRPEELFAEAEGLRQKYEEQASLEAIAGYRTAMSAWEKAGDKRNAALAGQRLGATLGQLGRLHESRDSYQEALPLAQESGDLLLESEIRSDVGIAQALVADGEQVWEEARQQCKLALDLARQLEATSAEADALSCAGEVEYLLQRPELALDLYREAGRLWELMGDPRGQAQALMYQGYVYSDMSRFDQAQQCFDTARSFWAAIGDKRDRATLLIAEARLQTRRGNYQEAMNGFGRALTLLEPMGDAVLEGSSLTVLARIYLDLGEARVALKHWERAFELFEAAGLNQIAIDVLNSLGQTYLASGDDASALSRFERALALAEEHALPRFSARALDFIGVVFLLRQLPGRAREELERSLEVQRSPGSQEDPRLEARTLVDLGEAYGLLGDHGSAATRFGEGLKLSTAAADRVSQARALFGLARASLGRRDFEAARAYIERSLEVVDSLRTAVESRDLRASYFASVHRYHEFHVDVLMRLDGVHPGEGLAAAAFEASEEARARSLLESLAEAEVDVRAGVDDDLLRREQQAKKSFDDWARKRAAVKSADEAEAMDEEYRDLEERYDQVEAELRSRSPRYAALAQPQPLTLPEVQAQVLDADTLLLEYALGEERSHLWAVSGHAQFSYTLPARAEIEEAAERVHELLTMRLTAAGDLADRQRRVAKADADYWTEAARLSEILLGPVATKLADQRILVVADGALQYLPFAALPVPGRPDGPVPLVVEHEVVHLPSASVLAVVRRETAGRTLPAGVVAVLADPVFESDDPRLQDRNGAAGQARRDGSGAPQRLAATRQEADAIVAAAPEGTAWRAIDFDASRATAMSRELAKYRIVHFATHGVFDNENPGLSGVMLSMFDAEGHPQDGFLRLRDIYGLDLPAELVVLSACNTALGKQVRGEGLVGIVRGFMYAGAKRVVASLWKVDDEATGQLMTSFYRHMLQEERSPAAALREAQLELWRQNRWQPPFYWAAFVLQGEWR